MDALTAGTPPRSRSRDTKTRTNIPNTARSNLDIALFKNQWSFASSRCKWWRRQTKKSAILGFSEARDVDLDLGWGHTAYRRASVIDLCVHTKFH